MKTGFVSAILPDLSFEEVIDLASQMNYECVEICCWPLGKAERRYSGITHIDVETLTPEKADSIKAFLSQKNIEISGLGYYPNPLDPDQSRREFFATHIRKVIDASAVLGINKMNTFIGRDRNKSVDDNFLSFEQVWRPLVEFAEERKVRIGIENCPMIFTPDEWPGGNNLATTPSIWRRMFSIIKSEYFGLNYDPSHLLWQQIDYVKPLYEFRDRIFHIHLKDARVHREKLDDVGIMATPLQFHTPKLPGLGDINWSRFFSTLNEINYKGAVCVEVEDKAFEGSLDDRKRALQLSKRYIDQYVI